MNMCLKKTKIHHRAQIVWNLVYVQHCPKLLEELLVSRCWCLSCLLSFLWAGGLCRCTIGNSCKGCTRASFWEGTSGFNRRCGRNRWDCIGRSWTGFPSTLANHSDSGSIACACTTGLVWILRCRTLTSGKFVSLILLGSL